jgi:hypothetical protein
LRDAEIQRSRRWRDPDRGKTRRAVYLWRDTLSENAATVVPMSMESNMRIAIIIAALLVLATPAIAKDPNDRMWVALKRVECGKIRVVIWREIDDPTDYYATREFRVNGTFLRVKGNFVYNDDTGETFLNGKPCKNTR